jgi:toxin-antitoxin system, toxin component, hicA family
MTSHEIIARLEADGWYHVATRGSHKQYKHPEKTGRVTVPHPKKDLPIGTVKSILRQVGLS